MTIYLTDGFDYIIDVLDKYINCCFFNEEQINKFIDFKKLIIKRKGIIKNKYWFLYYNYFKFPYFKNDNVLRKSFLTLMIKEKPSFLD